MDPRTKFPNEASDLLPRLKLKGNVLSHSLDILQGY